MFAGMRFALMQVKLGLATLVKNYKFTISSKMSLPITYQKNSILTSVTGGMWLEFGERKA